MAEPAQMLPHTELDVDDVDWLREQLRAMEKQIDVIYSRLIHVEIQAAVNNIRLSLLGGLSGGLSALAIEALGRFFS